MGQTLGYITERFSSAYLTFGIMSVFGVVLGSFLWSVVRGGFRFEWFASVGDFFRHLSGGLLMGFVGVLGMGCTIGQGVTGMSTLALGAVITLTMIIFGAALTMKMEYHMMDEQPFFSALRLSLADMRLLPSSGQTKTA